MKEFFEHLPPGTPSWLVGTIAVLAIFLALAKDVRTFIRDWIPEQAKKDKIDTEEPGGANINPSASSGILNLLLSPIKYAALIIVIALIFALLSQGVMYVLHILLFKVASPDMRELLIASILLAASIIFGYKDEGIPNGALYYWIFFNIGIYYFVRWVVDLYTTVIRN